MTHYRQPIFQEFELATEFFAQDMIIDSADEVFLGWPDHFRDRTQYIEFFNESVGKTNLLLPWNDVSSGKDLLEYMHRTRNNGLLIPALTQDSVIHAPTSSVQSVHEFAGAVFRRIYEVDQDQNKRTSLTDGMAFAFWFDETFDTSWFLETREKTTEDFSNAFRLKDTDFKDADFGADRWSEVLEAVLDEYGKNKKVALIVFRPDKTFGVFECEDDFILSDHASVENVFDSLLDEPHEKFAAKFHEFMVEKFFHQMVVVHVMKMKLANGEFVLRVHLSIGPIRFHVCKLADIDRAFNLMFRPAKALKSLGPDIHMRECQKEDLAQSLWGAAKHLFQHTRG